MSAETPPEGKKRRSTSIPFLVIVVVLGLVGYFKGEEIMTYTLYLQEKWSHDWKVSKDQRYDKLIGPPEEGDYGWVAPDAPAGNEGEPAANASSTENGDSEPSAATDVDMPK
jgi:hypothetical protein